MFKISAVIFLLCLAQLSFAKPNNPIKVDSTKKQTTQNNTTAGQKQQQNDTSKVNTLSIDTNKIQQQVVPPVVIDTVKKMDSVITEPVSEKRFNKHKAFYLYFAFSRRTRIFLFHIRAYAFQIVS
jgi:hypothetical protein